MLSILALNLGSAQLNLGSAQKPCAEPHPD